MKINELCAVEDNLRDQNWENNFLHELSLVNLNLLSADPQTGPDGWPYLFVSLDEQVSAESSQKILRWLSEKGIGLAVNPHKEMPDYILSYGMIWSFRETGYFFKPTENRDSTIESSAFEKNGEFKNSKVMDFGDANEAYFPKYARKILREFFRDQGILQVKVLLLSYDKKNYEIVFSLESLGNPPDKEHQGILEAISWFFPPHYEIVLSTEKNLPSFFNL